MIRYPKERILSHRVCVFCCEDCLMEYQYQVDREGLPYSYICLLEHLTTKLLERSSHQNRGSTPDLPLGRLAHEVIRCQVEAAGSRTENSGSLQVPTEPDKRLKFGSPPGSSKHSSCSVGASLEAERVGQDHCGGLFETLECKRRPILMPRRHVSSHEGRSPKSKGLLAADGLIRIASSRLASFPAWKEIPGD